MDRQNWPKDYGNYGGETQPNIGGKAMPNYRCWELHLRALVSQVSSASKLSLYVTEIVRTFLRTLKHQVILGAPGCNFAFFVWFDNWDLKPKSNIFRAGLAKFQVFLDLGIVVRDALVCVSNPEAKQMFRYSVLSQMRDAVSAKRMEATLLPLD